MLWWAVAAVLLYFYLDGTPLHTSRSVRRAYWAVTAGVCGYWLAATLHRMDAVWLALSAVLAASWVEDEVQKKVYLTPFASPEAAALKGASLVASGTAGVRGLALATLPSSPEAEGLAAAVSASADAISRHRGLTLSASQVLARVAGGLARERGRILAALAGCSRVELNHVLARVNLAALLEVSGARVVDLLALPAPAGRLDDLGVLARAAVVDALQKIGMRHRSKRQAWAASVLLATRGADLTRLKSLLDDGGDHHSFFRLATVDLQGGARRAVLDHVASEGAALLAAWRAAHPGGPPGVTLKVVSDIDDTLVCSGGHAPAGVDARLPRGCAYPGALAFYNELDTGHAQRILEATAPAAGSARSPRATPTADDAEAAAAARATRSAAARIRGAALGPWRQDYVEAARNRAAQAAGSGGCAPVGPAVPRPHQRGGHLVFLSARPETYRGYTEASSYRSIFRPMVRAREMHQWPVLLLGSLRAGPAALAGYLLRSSAPRGVPGTLATQLYVAIYRKKLERFDAFCRLYPEAAWVFVGDSGQGDVLLAEELSRRARAPPRAGGLPPLPLAACFVLRVAPVLDTLTALRSRKANKAAWLAEWRGEGIYLHKTHLGMAVQARTLGLIDEAGLQRVALEAAWGVRSARAAHAHASVDWARVARQLNKDVRAANQFLPADMQVAPIRVGGDDGAERVLAAARGRSLSRARSRGSSPGPGLGGADSPQGSSPASSRGASPPPAVLGWPDAAGRGASPRCDSGRPPPGPRPPSTLGPGLEVGGGVPPSALGAALKAADAGGARPRTAAPSSAAPSPAAVPPTALGTSPQFELAGASPPVRPLWEGSPP